MATFALLIETKVDQVTSQERKLFGVTIDLSVVGTAVNASDGTVRYNCRTAAKQIARKHGTAPILIFLARHGTTNLNVYIGLGN